MAATEAGAWRQTVLVIAAHPDDIESWCAGTVAGLVRSGWRAVYVLCTSGEKGTSDPSEAPQSVAVRREQEQREAARIVGADEPVFLRLGDGDLEDSRELRGLLVREIRRHRPRLLITHDPVHPWPPYTTHRDHRIAGRVALDAAYPYARDPLHFPEHLASEGLSPHVVAEAWLFSSDTPDHFVDISATLDTKIAARLAHASQTSDPDALAESWRRRARETGAAAGLPHAEAFKRVVL
ncbi:MAG TPA: PIG-L deacetylase family protein [Ktedonobacterales bacterium]|nr:PIG-L deacetylase family protein [Ktedonobacterales bacterium]